jgi:DNA-binding PucR family transcriptional regulator
VPPVARELVVHVNTVNYRLRRVHELTGLDPRIPNQAAMLMLALKGEMQLR